jgi:uncharacterized protein YndB with AHSA1/START domain
MSIGLTKDTGWQIGVRRTLGVNSQHLWDYLTSPRGIQLWLGPWETFSFVAGSTYKLEDGTTGEVRVIQSNSHWRITRHPRDPDYDRPSTIQIRVIPKGEKTILAFHEEHLPTENQRLARKVHYLWVVDRIRQELTLA